MDNAPIANAPIAAAPTANALRAARLIVICWTDRPVTGNPDKFLSIDIGLNGILMDELVNDALALIKDWLTPIVHPCRMTDNQSVSGAFGVAASGGILARL